MNTRDITDVDLNIFNYHAENIDDIVNHISDYSRAVDTTQLIALVSHATEVARRALDILLTEE